MTDLSTLAEMEHDDPEYIPEILPVDARLSIKAPVAKLLELFSRAAAVTPPKETIPGTAHALLEAVQTSNVEVAHARITASDGDQTVSVVVDGITVLMGGAVLVPAKRIHDILKLAPTQTAKIEVIGTAALIRAGRAQWTVQTPVGDSLSTLLDVSDIEMQDVPVGPFVNALSVARRAASTTDARRSLMQVQLRNGAFTACDGGRLHRADVRGIDTALDLTIPVKVVDELLKALRGTDASHMQLGYDDKHLVFRIEQDSIVAQRLLLPFPEVESLLLGPAFSNVNSLTVNRLELSSSIQRVRINADPDSAVIFLGLVPGKKDDQGQLSWSLSVRARDRQGNASQEVIECQWVGTGKARELAFNHHYLSDLLAVYDSETVVFKVGDDTKTLRTPLFLEDKEIGFTGIVQQVTGVWAT